MLCSSKTLERAVLAVATINQQGQVSDPWTFSAAFEPTPLWDVVSGLKGEQKGSQTVLSPLF